MASHKYIERKWVNGQWVYKYRTDEKSSDQLRRDTKQEEDYRARMIDQSHKNYVREREKDPNSKATERADRAFDRNIALYGRHIGGNNVANAILDPDEYQAQLRGAYKNQSLGTKIKADARSAVDDVKAKTKEFRDTVSKSISDKKAHNLMLKQNKKAAKQAAKAQKKAPKIAEKIAKSNKKMSEISPKNTKAGEDFLTKILVSDYQRMLLGDKKPKK